jgi:3-dehydroquinate synthetase
MSGLATGNGFPNVVVTGVAMTTALATDAEETWKRLLDGQSGIRKLEDSFVEEFDLPVRIPADIPTRALMEALFKDKKFEAGAIRFVLTAALGSAFVANRVTEEDIRMAIDDVRT